MISKLRVFSRMLSSCKRFLPISAKTSALFSLMKQVCLCHLYFVRRNVCLSTPPQVYPLRKSRLWRFVSGTSLSFFDSSDSPALGHTLLLWSSWGIALCSPSLASAYFHPKVPSVFISNSTLDAAKTNRVVQILRSPTTKAELEALAIGVCSITFLFCAHLRL